MQTTKNVRCLYVTPPAGSNDYASLDLQEALCHAFVYKQGWTVCKESFASLSFDDESAPSLSQQLIDVCCTAALSDFDVLLIASRQCRDMPEEYIRQVIEWLCENNVEIWSVCEGKLS